MWRRSVAGSLPRRGVGCCVPLLTHLRSLDSISLCGRSGLLAPARLLPGLFFWPWRSCYGERRPSVSLTQIKATHALLRMIKPGSGRASGGAAVIGTFSLEGHGRLYIASARPRLHSSPCRMRAAQRFRGLPGRQEATSAKSHFPIAAQKERPPRGGLSEIRSGVLTRRLRCPLYFFHLFSCAP
jgi:hypothetical protein